MKMSKNLASCFGIKVDQLKVMCGLALDSETANDKAGNSVTPDPIPTNKFLTVFRQRLKSKQLEREFKSIGTNCEDHSANAALRNVLLNVKQDVVTYDHSRVIVWDIPESVGTDYYNASFVDGYNGPKEYIAVQGPSSKCLASFWHLVWQEGVTCIVMSTGLFENAVQQCDKYWVDHTRKYSRHGDIHIWHERSVYLAKLNIRTFRIQKNGSCESRLLTHFEMVGFHEENPDPGLVLEVRRRVNALAATQPGPVLVHCRCGGGRTAVYISVDFCLHQLHAEDRVDVYNTVLHLRRFRRGMVRTLSQYTQIYTAVAMYLQCGVTVHPALTLPATVHVHYHLGEDSKHLRLEKEFHILQAIVPRLSIGDCASGHRVENRSKSRDIMMLPPECARPYLTTADCGDSGTDFINAVYVDGYHFENAFLVTQWPMKCTVADLWRLLFDFKITSLVLMNDIRKFSRKYPRFWPKEIDQVVAYGPISVRYLGCERKSNLTVRTFTIRKVLNTLVGCEMRMDEQVVKMFQVLGQPGEATGHDHTDGPRLEKQMSRDTPGDSDRPGWSASNDHEDPRQRHRVRSPASQGQRNSRGFSQWSESLLSCMEQVYEWQRRTGSRQPVCVVSKDGNSRVGSFCAIGVACDQARVEKEVDVFNAVRLVRKNRPQLVPNIEEYQFIYQFMADFITQSNSKPEIVISEPEVTPDCFSPSLSLSPVAPVVRSQFGGINVAAPGKIFNPNLASPDERGLKPNTSTGFNVNAVPSSISQPNQVHESLNSCVFSEVSREEYNNGSRKSNLKPSQSFSFKENSQPSEHNVASQQLENVPTKRQFMCSGKWSNGYEDQCNTVGNEQHVNISIECHCSNQTSLKGNSLLPTFANNCSNEKLFESSNYTRPNRQCANYLHADTCRSYSDNVSSFVEKTYSDSFCSEVSCCHCRNERCSSNHEYLHVSMSQSHLSSQPNPPQGSPWFHHARSKPTTPHRKVSWPPPAALSPGQYINPSTYSATSASIIPTVSNRFFPPPVPPPTPCLRLSQLSTLTNSTSFYSCHSELSIAMVNSSSCQNTDSVTSNQFHHCGCCCKSELHFPSASHSAGLPSTSTNESVKRCHCSSHTTQQNLEISDNNGCQQVSFAPSTIHHLDVPKNTRQEVKANIHYFNSLAYQKLFHSKDTSATSSKNSTHTAGDQHLMRQQDMRMGVPSGGGNPTDFKLIHASYASLDESVCSSVDNNIRPRSQTNGNILKHCLKKSAADMDNNNDNNSSSNHNNSRILNPTVQEKRSSCSGLAIRRLSKRCSAEEILLDNKKSEDEYQDRKTVTLGKKSTLSSLWRRPFKKRVKS